MRHLILQRVAVRMLYDPALVAEVYRDASRPLSGLDLSPSELAWLTRPDARAFTRRSFGGACACAHARSNSGEALQREVTDRQGG